MLRTITYLLLLCLWCGWAQEKLPVQLLGGSPVLPGVHTRLTRKFFDTATKAGSEVIDKVLSGPNKIKFPDTEQSGDFGLGFGSILLKDLTLDKYKNSKPYVFEVVPPYSFRFGIDKADVQATSDFEYIVAPPKTDQGGIGAVVGQFLERTGVSKFLQRTKVAAGTAKVNTKASVDTVTRIDKTPEGIMQAHVTSCKTTLDDLNLAVTVTEGDAKVVPFITGDKSILSALATPIIEKRLCEEIQKMVDTSINERLNSQGGFFPLSQLQKIQTFADHNKTSAERKATPRPNGKALGLAKKANTSAEEDIKYLLGNITKDFYVDYHLQQPVLFLGAKPYDFIEAKYDGEISYQREGGAPFNPIGMPALSGFDKMIYLRVSDFVINSFLYSLYKHRKNNDIQLVVNSTTLPSQAGLLKTTCESGFCFGDAFSEIATQHPNKDVELLLMPINQPYIVASPNLLKGEISEEIYGFVRKPGTTEKTLVLRGNLTAKPEAKIETKGNKVFGKLELKDFKMPLTVQGKTTSEWSELVQLMMEDSINERLTAGVPLPSISAAELVDTDVKIEYRNIYINTDVKVNKDELAKIVDEQVRKNAEKSS